MTWRLPGAHRRHGIGWVEQLDDADDLYQSAPAPDVFQERSMDRTAATDSTCSRLQSRKRTADAMGFAQEEMPGSAEEAPADKATRRLWQAAAYSEELPGADFAGGLYSGAFSANRGFCSGIVYDLEDEDLPDTAQAAKVQVSGVATDQNVASASLAPASSAEESFVAEVWRITSARGTEYRSILGLQSSERNDLQAVQSKYRRLMRLLHPDKRRDDEVERAGGLERCDEAVRLVQQAAASAKKELQPVVQEQVQSSNAQSAPSSASRPVPFTRGATAEVYSHLKRVQEVQRQQARQAMQRNQSGPDVDSLLEDISQALGDKPSERAVRAAEAPPSNSTTAQLMGLLAGLRQQQ